MKGNESFELNRTWAKDSSHQIAVLVKQNGQHNHRPRTNKLQFAEHVSLLET